MSTIQTAYFKTQVNHIHDQTPCVRTLYLDIPANYPAFEAGQCLDISLKNNTHGNAVQVRKYCICSLPLDNTIELAIDLINEKGMSGLLHQLKAGTLIHISPPSGNFRITPKTLTGHSILLIGFGAAIGVMYGLMRQYYQIKPPNLKSHVHFYALNADENTLPYEAELEKATSGYPRLEIYPVLQTNGYDTDDISDRILSHIHNPAEWDVYIAGAATPTQELKNLLVENGFAAHHIQTLPFE